MSVRISGLVKLMNDVRSRLQEPLQEKEAGQLSALITKNLESVRHICREQGVEVKDLPAPSRNAFSYLEKLTIKKGTISKDQDRADKFSIRGLKPSVTSFLNQLAAADSEQKHMDFFEECAVFLKKISTQLKRKSKKMEDLPPKQQRLLLRMQQYTEEQQQIFPANAGFLIALIEAGWPSGFFRQEIPLVFFIPSDTRLWQIKPGNHVFISDLYLLADKKRLLEDLSAVICGAAGRRKVRRRSIKDWLRSETVLDFKGRIEDSLSHDSAAAVGVVYDLNQLFEKINSEYFSYSLKKNGLYWTRSQARCRTGYYNPMSDEIFISAALDSRDVPQYVVEFVLYHEMLHKKQGKDLFLSGKRIHSKLFKQEEQRFKYYHKAEIFLQKLASRRW